MQRVLRFGCQRLDRVMFCQQAQVGFAQSLQRRRIGVDNHAVVHLGGTTGNRPHLAVNFDQTQPAAAVGLEAVVVAQMRHVGAGRLQRLQQQRTGGIFKWNTIDG